MTLPLFDPDLFDPALYDSGTSLILTPTEFFTVDPQDRFFAVPLDDRIGVIVAQTRSFEADTV